MPAERTTSNSRKGRGTVATISSPIPLVVRYNGRSIAIPRRVNQKDALKTIKETFRQLNAVDDGRIRLLSRFPSFGEEKIEIPSGTWETLVETIREVWIEVSEEPQDLVQSFDFQKNKNVSGKVTVIIKISTLDRRIYLSCDPSVKVGRIIRAAARTSGVCSEDYRWTHDDYQRLNLDDTLKDLEFESGDTILGHLEQKGGKPVIYLFPPKLLENVNIKLSLVPSWSFSVLYPPVPISSDAHREDHNGETQTVAWDVSAAPDGTLRDKSSNLSVSYLFWEALTNPPRPLSPPSSRPSSPTLELEFDPARACDWMTPASSVVLPIKDIPHYLDAALKLLMLHTEARTSFITYWLPSLLKHSHVALRFLPQTAYEGSAPLSVNPEPDIVTRVFMIFRGVSEDEERWNEARLRANQDVTEVWKDAVGIDAERASDVSLFRVLEWGGMEVLYEC
ncbi:hypothetical protein SCHPADRAFT_905931 [Schizopora paradoxa]|uniref:Ubiquitin-like domain-containing protein n=1 Tax=Schizopora paradoxa TaxID=27342 RepID=A0A0H2RIP1_9AGAM|nr:hypothetical protein SCHPADRAFT_905931 [Schizopora paradoxa]